MQLLARNKCYCLSTAVVACICDVAAAHGVQCCVLCLHVCLDLHTRCCTGFSRQAHVARCGMKPHQVDRQLHCQPVDACSASRCCMSSNTMQRKTLFTYCDTHLSLAYLKRDRRRRTGRNNDALDFSRPSGLVLTSRNALALSQRLLAGCPC